MLARHNDIDPYEVPKMQGIYTELPQIENDLTVEALAMRVKENKSQYMMKFSKKKSQQDMYYENKVHLDETASNEEQ